MKNNELLSKIVNRLQEGPGLILLHHNADIDAIGSAIALQGAYPTYSIGALQNVSRISKRLLKRFDSVTIITDPKLEDYNSIVILDTSTPSQLGIEPNQLKNPIVIDHHVSNYNWNTDLYYCDEEKSSCAEIIFELLESIDFVITQKMTLALLLAILTDSGHFKYATSETLMNFAKLLELGNLKANDVFDVLENSNKMHNSQRIAHLKGAQRLKFEQINKYLVASTMLSSYEASMCKFLINLGADIAFVGAQRDDHVRISGRATNELVNSGLHLGEFFKEISNELACEGGGHDGAAGLNGIGDVEMILNACMNKIAHILRSI